jgi:hypothetical protein
MATDPTDDLPAVRDPGGAHSKGYTAETRKGTDDPPDPIPLADPPAGAVVRPPDQPQRTGRNDTGTGLILPEGG